MTPFMRSQFMASVFAAGLLAPLLPATMSAPRAASPVQKDIIGHIKLPAKLPFTPQEMAEPFGFKVRLTEKKEERQTVMTNFFGSHLFTFFYDEKGDIMAVYSPLKKDDGDLCYALGVLKEEKPPIYQYLETSFQASSHCPGFHAPAP